MFFVFLPRTWREDVEAGMIMRIISNRYAVRCPGCGFRLLGHRAEGEILGEVVWRTKSFLKPRTQQVSTMHLPCWQRTEVGEELQEARAVVPRCCFSGHTSPHNTKLDGWEKFPVGRYHTLVSDEQSVELHIPSGLINHTKPKCIFSAAVFLTTVGGSSLNWSPL